MRVHLLIAFCFALLTSAFTTVAFADSGKTVDRDWTIDGVKRTAIIWMPGDSIKRPADGWPVVFVFHGHGGSSAQARRVYGIEKNWPDAVVVYPQGLPTVGQITDPQGNLAGWDATSAASKNRDIRFFDAMLNSLKSDDGIDPKHVYAAGHSNGGSFTYALWAMRGDDFAAVAPSSAVRGRDIGDMKPKPALMSGGKNDPLVKWQWQDRMMTTIKKIDGCSGEGKAWGKEATWFDSSSGTPVVTIVYDGGHAPPAGLGEMVAKFFQAVSKN